MTDTMLAGRLNYATGSFEVKEIPVPTPGPGEVRVRVRAAGICLSDVHAIDRSVPPAFSSGETTLGHEVAGDIDMLGDGVESIEIGTRVILHAGRVIGGRVEVLGENYDGGWAEYVVVEAFGVIPIPESISYQHAAVIPDAVSTPWGAIEWTGEVRAGEAVGVWGIGGLGTHAIQLVRLVGAAPIIAVDPSDDARTRALALGADYALDPTAADFEDVIRKLTDSEGVAVALEFAGVAAARSQALKSLSIGGRLVLVGVDTAPMVIDDLIEFHGARLKVLGHLGYEPRHIEELVKFVALGRLDLSQSVSLELPLAEAARGVELLSKNPGQHVRIVLIP